MMGLLIGLLIYLFIGLIFALICEFGFKIPDEIVEKTFGRYTMDAVSAHFILGFVQMTFWFSWLWIMLIMIIYSRNINHK